MLTEIAGVSLLLFSLLFGQKVCTIQKKLEAPEKTAMEIQAEEYRKILPQVWE